MVRAASFTGSEPESNFITVAIDQNNDSGPDPVKLAARTTRAFLGFRLDCMQCHDDMFGDRWKQKDFHQLAAFYAPAKNTITGVRDEDKTTYQYTFNKRNGDVDVHPMVPFLPELQEDRGSLRTQLAHWVTHPENKAFARTAVNRVWALLFGRPLVEPVDSIPLDGPWPPGMETLAEDFMGYGYDLQRLIRLIAATRVFQLDSRAMGADETISEVQEKALASFVLSRLRPEQVAGSILQASSLTTIDAQSHILIKLARAAQQGDFVKRYGDIGEDEFGADGGTIPQKLLLMNGDLVQEKIGDNIFVNAATRIGALAPTDTSAVETAYLAVLSRRPTPAEADYFEEKLAACGKKERSNAMADIYWSLINATEFSWNH
ncbi:MAG: DUF1553 domain-containing protein [Verrucomicrobiota bacterium]